jgi:hypothetical protein
MIAILKNRCKNDPNQKFFVELAHLQLKCENNYRDRCFKEATFL